MSLMDLYTRSVFKAIRELTAPNRFFDLVERMEEESIPYPQHVWPFKFEWLRERDQHRITVHNGGSMGGFLLSVRPMKDPSSKGTLLTLDDLIEALKKELV